MMTVSELSGAARLAAGRLSAQTTGGANNYIPAVISR